MARSRSNELVRKSVAAMVSAIEVYNKPDHKYREETFAILALNAWELLFKAKLLEEEGNDIRSLYVYERRTLAGGSLSQREYIRRNRAGNPMTISLGRALGTIEGKGLAVVDPALRANLDALGEIRDNAVHLLNMSPDLSKAVQELGTATLQNYVTLIKEWFNVDLSRFNFYLMPLSFFRDFETAKVLQLSAEESNIAKYLAKLHREHDTESSGEDGYAVVLELDVRLKRSALSTAARLVHGDDPDAMPVTFTEEDIRELYPWDYNDLTERLRHRYSDFKANNDYHSVRKPLLKDKRYVMSRYLDPDNPKSLKKDFYSPNILDEFGKHYIRV
jgi:hypothetical protein